MKVSQHMKFLLLIQAVLLKRPLVMPMNHLELIEAYFDTRSTITMHCAN